MPEDAHPTPPDEATPRRSLLRAWAEVRGLRGGHTGAHRHVGLQTADGVRLAATLLPGPGNGHRLEPDPRRTTSESLSGSAIGSARTRGQSDEAVAAEPADVARIDDRDSGVRGAVVRGGGVGGAGVGVRSGRAAPAAGGGGRPSDAGSEAGPGPAIVVLHGFAAHRRKPRYAWLADELATRFTVLAVDLRGHGGSGGSSGLGGTEAADVAAAVGWLRDRGHDWVAVVGASMGATSTANALARGVGLDAAVLLSGPGWIELEPTTTPMRRMRALWYAPLGRVALRAVTGVRVDAPDDWAVPVDPAAATDDLSVPLLVVHGQDDEWFPAAHAHALVTGARAGTLWLEDRFGHAEDGFDDPFGRRLATALLTAHRTGTFPSRQEVPW